MSPEIEFQTSCYPIMKTYNFIILSKPCICIKCNHKKHSNQGQPHDQQALCRFIFFHTSSTRLSFSLYRPLYTNTFPYFKFSEVLPAMPIGKNTGSFERIPDALPFGKDSRSVLLLQPYLKTGNEPGVCRLPSLHRVRMPYSRSAKSATMSPYPHS